MDKALPLNAISIHLEKYIPSVSVTINLNNVLEVDPWTYYNLCVININM
jgi:hypothetical protein